MVKLDKKLGLGNLSCKVCGQRFQTGINCKYWEPPETAFIDCCLPQIFLPLLMYTQIGSMHAMQSQKTLQVNMRRPIFLVRDQPGMPPQVNGNQDFTPQNTQITMMVTDISTRWKGGHWTWQSSKSHKAFSPLPKPSA